MVASMTRREALAALVGGTGTLLAPAKLQSIGFSKTRGCLISSSRVATFQASGVHFFQTGERLTTTTGDRSLDRSLGRALVRLSTLFSERPGFGFIDDSDGPNAYATSETQVQGTWGTVLFGRSLFEDLMQRYQDRGMAVLTVAAHEFGHIAQFRSGVDRRLLQGQHTVKRVELHADLLSGYYLGVRKRQQPSISIWAAGHTLFRIGDYEFNDRNHHGTPDERVAAAEEGFKMGQGGKIDFGQVFSWGVEHVLTNF